MILGRQSIASHGSNMDNLEAMEGWIPGKEGVDLDTTLQLQ
jgi:hypothetical protein